ncbi:MAG: hypothetical protein K9L26_03310 [Candidatus Izimaplasma sp.]|nr:hypothetical protein [Candidatus Izimaplasma bacterium]
MKKVLLFFMASFVVLLGLGTMGNVQAEEIIDLYPYDKEACLNAEESCPNTKVGDSHWDVTYYGHRYHVVSGNARYAVEFDDANSDGLYDFTEYPSASWSSFGGLFVNDTASEVIIDTGNSRGDTSNNSTPRIWVYFDADGNAIMYEDNYINKFDLYNDGDATTPDWRFATAAEVTAYTDAETELTDAITARDAVYADTNSTQQEKDDADAVVTTKQAAFDAIDAVTKIDALIRMKMDDTDTDGYVVEPLASLKWYKEGIDPLVDTDETTWSDIITDDPNNVVIPAGWSVLYFGYLDRDGANNVKTTDYTGMFPEAMLDTTTAPATVTYDDQPAWYTGLAALDDDPATDGINVVVDYNGTFEMPTTVEAVWTDMFDASGQIINNDEQLDFTVEIADETGVLETLTYTWNETNEEYDLSAEQTVIDTSVFGKGYTATFNVTTPEGDVTEEMIDIVIGVMPPRFIGVDDRYVNEDAFVDLLQGVTADDGYGNDVTDTIEVTLPDGFNQYYPQPGEYTIDLEFTHHVHFDGVEPELFVDSVEQTWDGEINPEAAINANSGKFMVYTDSATFHDAGSGWGSVMVLVGADGLVDEIYDRYDWDYTTSSGTVLGDATAFATWQAAVVIPEGGYVVAAHGTPNGQTLRDENLAYDAPISITWPEPDFDYDIVTETSYVLTVDDITAPNALIVNDEMQIVAGEHTDIDDVILSNVVALDNSDAIDDLAIYVSNNGGLLLDTADTYTVEVTVEDLAGNTDVVTFSIIVVEPTLTEAEVQAMLDNQTITADEVQALLDAQILTEADVQALIDADLLTDEDVQTLIDASIDEYKEEVLAETGCGSSLATGSIVVVLFAALGGAGLFFIRKK